MLFRDYKTQFDKRRSEFRFPQGTVQKGVGCETRMKPLMPPWIVDWAVLYADGYHFRVKESYKPKSYPLSVEGERMHFSYQYGATTATDEKGMPRTGSDRDTVIRIDRDPYGPHLHYAGQSHVKQDQLRGSFIIDKAELFEFVEAVQTCRQSGCSMEEVLFFELKKARQ